MRWFAALAALVGCGDSTGTNDAPPMDVTVEVSAPDAPDAIVAVRAGEGTWTTMQGSDTPFQFEARGPYTVAIGCTQTNEAVMYELTTDELSTLVSDLPCTASPTASVTITGAVTLQAPNTAIRIGIGHEAMTIFDPAPTYTITTPAGTHDIVAAAFMPGPGGTFLNRIRVLHDVALIADATIDLDLTNASPLAGAGTSSETYQGTRSELVTARRTRFTLSDSRYRAYSHLADDHLGPEDRQVLTLQYPDQPRVSVELIDRVPEEVPVTFPILGPTSYPDRVEWRPQPDAIAYALRTTGRTVFASPAVFEEDWTVYLPDVSAIPGWNFIEVTPMWSIAVITSSESLGDAIRLVPRTRTQYLTMQ